jgi:hypothetical protein
VSDLFSFLMVGLVEVDCELTYCIGTTFKDRILGGEMRKKALELGVATEAELDEMGAEWQRFMDTPDATCGTIHGQLLVTKR